MGRVVTLGWVCLDHRFRVERFPPVSARAPVSGYRADLGGSAAVAAATICRLGGGASVVGRGGDDATGDRLAAILAAEGVDTSAYRRVPGARTPTTAVLVDPAGERWIFPFRGDGLDSDPSWIPAGLLDGCGCVLIDMRWPEGGLHLARLARLRGIPVVLDFDRDTNEAWDLVGLATHAVADEELGQALGGPERLLARIAERGAWGAVTLGAAGVVHVGGQVASFRVPVADTTGAGDVFHGAFALGVARGLPATDSLQLASAAAAVRCRTAELPTREAVEQLLESRDGQAFSR